MPEQQAVTFYHVARWVGIGVLVVIIPLLSGWYSAALEARSSAYMAKATESVAAIAARTAVAETRLNEQDRRHAETIERLRAIDVKLDRLLERKP